MTICPLAAGKGCTCLPYPTLREWNELRPCPLSGRGIGAAAGLGEFALPMPSPAVQPRRITHRAIHPGRRTLSSTSRSQDHNQRVRPEAALVVVVGSPFLLGVRGDRRRVEGEDQPGRSPLVPKYPKVLKDPKGANVKTARMGQTAKKARKAKKASTRTRGPAALRPDAYHEEDWAAPWARGCFHSYAAPGSLTAFGRCCASPPGGSISQAARAHATRPVA